MSTITYLLYLIWKYKSILQKGRRTKDNRQPAQMAFSEDTDLSVSELHGVFIKAELSPRTLKRS